MEWFKTDDGYTLTHVGAVWTDGDIVYDDVNGWPVDLIGTRLDGRIVRWEN